MEYEALIREIKRYCVKENISHYKLSKMSGVPISTIYGVLNNRNRAQFDTICELLDALKLRLVLVPENEQTNLNQNLEMEEDYGINTLSAEKRELVTRLIQYLQE